MRARKGIVALAAIATLGLALTGCGGKTDTSKDAEDTDKGEETTADAGEVSIGVALPQKTSQNWVEAEEMFKADCAETGADCIIQFANGGVSEQQNQISSMIENGVDVLIIGAIDGSQLGSQLAQAKAAGIPIIAYDRLLTNTEDVDYYIAYDNFQVGQLQATALLQGLEESGATEPYTIELFAGSPDDANSLKFFDGAMDVLQPAIDEGTVEVGSGQVDFAQVVTQGWEAKNAQNRMAAILTANYPGDEMPDGVLSPNDNLARAIITAHEQGGKDNPVVTGQDSEDESVVWVTEGRQYSTIYKDTRALVEDSVKLAIAVALGDPIPDMEGVTIDEVQYESTDGHPVTALLLTPQIVTADNVNEVYANDAHRIELVESAQ